MAEVIGVRFKQVGKVYYFDPDGKKLKIGDTVIVETSRGIECGEVAIANKNVPDEEIVHPLKKLIRTATKEDLRRLEDNRRKEKEALRICEQKVVAHGLDMKLVDVEYTFDNSKILFYFTADGRVDLRRMRQTLLLLLIPRRVPPGVHKNGQGAGTVAFTHKDLRHLRQTDVLPQIRAGRIHRPPQAHS